MYAQFQEADASSASGPQFNNSVSMQRSGQPIHDPLPVEAPGATGVEVPADDASSGVAPPVTLSVVEASNIIGALRTYVHQQSSSLAPAWRRYRHVLPTSVAELKILPSSPESFQATPTHTFALQLNTEPETTVSEYCKQLVEYVMTHLQHVSAQSPVLMLRFVKVGTMVAQCVVTVGGGNVPLTRQLVANLSEVGFHTGFVANKQLQPCATLQLWEVKKIMNDGRGIRVADIELLLAADGPNGQPIPGSVSVVPGYEDGVFYAATKRPDVVHAWLLNPTSSWLFQRELYEKLGVLIIIAPCEHEWAHRKGQQWLQQDDEGMRPSSSARSRDHQTGGDNSSDSSASSDEEEEELLPASAVDIFGNASLAPTAGAPPDGFDISLAHRAAPPPQYAVEFPEIVGDDEDDEATYGDQGLLGTAPRDEYGQPMASGAFSEDPWRRGGGETHYPPHPDIRYHHNHHYHHDGRYTHHHHHHHQSYGMPPPPVGDRSHVPPPPPHVGGHHMPVYPTTTYSSIPQSFHRHDDRDEWQHTQPMRDGPKDAFQRRHDPMNHQQPAYPGDHSGAPPKYGAPTNDFAFVPEITVPVVQPVMMVDKLLALLDRLDSTPVTHVAHVVSEPDSYRILFDFVSNNNIDAMEASERQRLVDRLVAALLQPLPPPARGAPPEPLRFKPQPCALDNCLHDRHIGTFPMLCKLLKQSAMLREAVALRLVGHFHRLPFRTLCLALLDGDPSPANPLVHAFVEDPVQWCVDAAAVTRGHLFHFPHLMVPYGTNGFRTLFERSSSQQQAALQNCVRALTRDDVRTILDQSELMGRALFVSAMCSSVIDAVWLLQCLGQPPADCKHVGQIIDFAAVVVYGRGDTLMCDGILSFAGQFCALVEASQDMLDEQKLDFLHNSVLRRFFAPAQEKYHILRDAFLAKLQSMGMDQAGLLASVLATASWPRRPLPSAAGGGAAKGASKDVGLLPTPQGPLLPLPPPPYGKTPATTAVQEAAVPLLPPPTVAFSWNTRWDEVFSAYPAAGDPFPELNDPEPQVSTEEPQPDAAQTGSATTMRWKSSVSKSYGHYYFKSDDKHSKPSYRHPKTQCEYMVSPQTFLLMESNNETTERIVKQSGASAAEYEAWAADQRRRDRRLDEAVLSCLKITYRGQQGERHGVGSAAGGGPSESFDASRILKAQRDLERKLRFIQDNKYPSRGHPFPPLPKGWSCSLSASNGLYYFRKPHAARGDKPSYEHPQTKLEYAPTPQAYAFFEGINEGKLQSRLVTSSGVTKDRIANWLADQTVRDADIDYYVVEKIGVKYDSAKHHGGPAKRARSDSRGAVSSSGR